VVAPAQLLGARNEFVSFQVVIAGGSAGAKNVRLAPGKALSGVGGSIPTAKNVTIYREEYYKTEVASTGTRPAGRWPDALIPSVDALYNEVRKAFPIDVPANENRVAWVDILVPETLHAGLYDGDLVLSSDSGQSTIPVHLDVRNLTLPSTTSLKSLFRIHAEGPCQATHPGCTASDGQLGWSTNYDYARLALDNRITIANSQFQTPERQPVASHPVIDNFKKYQLPLINGTDPTARLRGAQTTTFAVVNDATSGAWKQQADDGGFADRSVLYTLRCDEPNSPPVSWSACKDEVVRAHLGANWPGLPNVLTASIQDVDTNDFRGFTDVLAPVMSQMHDRGTPFPGARRMYDDFLANPTSSCGCTPPVRQPIAPVRPQTKTNQLSIKDGWTTPSTQRQARTARWAGWRMSTASAASCTTASTRIFRPPGLTSGKPAATATAPSFTRGRSTASAARTRSRSSRCG
jgi:hypothetical protein